MNADIYEIGEKMKNLREKSGLTQKQVADYLSVDQSLISKFEKGERTITSSALEQLATLFCCPVSSIISGEKITPTYSIAFRTSDFKRDDLSSLAVINKIALNQFKMDKLYEDVKNDK